MTDKPPQGPEVTEHDATEHPERSWDIIYSTRCPPPPISGLPLVRTLVKQLFIRGPMYVEIRRPPRTRG